MPPHAVLLSFDDAYADHFEYVFPILEHEHIQGAFYPPVKAVTEHTVLDVNKIHFILASTPEDNFPVLLNEIKQLILTNTDEFGLNHTMNISRNWQWLTVSILPRLSS